MLHKICRVFNLNKIKNKMIKSIILLELLFVICLIKSEEIKELSQECNKILQPLEIHLVEITRDGTDITTTVTYSEDLTICFE